METHAVNFLKTESNRLIETIDDECDSLVSVPVKKPKKKTKFKR